MKSTRDEAARGSIPGSSPRPDRGHGKPQPTTCYTVVCVKTAVEISEESRKNPSLVCWAGRWFRAGVQKFHFAITGTTRSGKSLLLSLYLRSVISQITPGSGRRLILFDPKNELHPDLFEGVEVPVHFMLPSDRRSSRWDLARDYKSPAATKQLSEGLVPPVSGDSTPFFVEAAQALISGVITSLDITHPGRWDLGDVVHILESRTRTAKVLGRTPETRSTREKYMREKKMWAGIAATAENVMGDMRIVAALWSRARRKFSLTDFVRSEGIVVLGRDPRYAAVMDPLNQLFFTLLFGQLLAQEDSKTPRTWLVIDELTVAAGEKRPLPGFKDICERGASRGVVVAVTYLSYASLKAIYGDDADAILGMLQHRVFLVAGDSSTAEFASKLFGKTREWVPMTSVTTAPDGAFGERVSRTESLQWHEEDVVPYDKFIHLTPPSSEEGLWGYRLNPGNRNSGLFHLGPWGVTEQKFTV
jgi:Type IV secretion-system coupling protein DNA-binding domain